MEYELLFIVALNVQFSVRQPRKNALKAFELIALIDTTQSIPMRTYISILDAQIDALIDATQKAYSDGKIYVYP